ncbi:MAG: hypothetical protein WKF75_09490, partial [Singulisphaera sp.]
RLVVIKVTRSRPYRAGARPCVAPWSPAEIGPTATSYAYAGELSMKNRKGSILALTTLAVGLGFAGLGLAAADDESPLHKAMEGVQAKNAFILKNLKTAAVFKKNQKEIAQSATALATRARACATPRSHQEKKKARALDQVHGRLRQGVRDLRRGRRQEETTQADAKTKFKVVTATCTACHKEFRPED